MIGISLTEFRKNFKKYLELLNTQDILVTSYGKPLTLLRKPDKYDVFLSCCGLIKDFDYDKSLQERDNNR